jgi:hypothetical protein
VKLTFKKLNANEKGSSRRNLMWPIVFIL